MTRLIFVTNVWQDGFIEDERGSFAFTEPDETAMAALPPLSEVFPLTFR
jgi:hypothetical protein